MALTPEIVNVIRREIAYLDELTMKNIAREEGLAEGLAEGRKTEQRDIARKMKEKGLDPQLIIETTGLRLEEVEEL